MTNHCLGLRETAGGAKPPWTDAVRQRRSTVERSPTFQLRPSNQSAVKSIDTLGKLLNFQKAFQNEGKPKEGRNNTKEPGRGEASEPALNLSDGFNPIPQSRLFRR